MNSGGKLPVVIAAALASTVAAWAFTRWRHVRKSTQETAPAPSPAHEPALKPLPEHAPAPVPVPVPAPVPAPAPDQAHGQVVSAPLSAPAPTSRVDADKMLQLVALASKKKQSGNESLAAGKHEEALELFEGALKALQYVVPARGIISSTDPEHLVEARVLQSACALNGALVCLKLERWDRAADLASQALDLEKSGTGVNEQSVSPGDPVRMGKALYRRSMAFFELGKAEESLADLRQAAAYGGLGNDVGVLELRARVACRCATALLGARQVSAAEGVFQEAMTALDKLPVPKQSSTARAPGSGAESLREHVKAEAAYGLAECAALRGAAREAARLFAAAAQAAARWGSGSAVRCGEDGAGRGGRGKEDGAGAGGGSRLQICRGDIGRLRVMALERCVRCFNGLAAVEDAERIAKELVEVLETRRAAAAERSGEGKDIEEEGLEGAWGAVCEVELARAEDSFNRVGAVRMCADV
jgi:tetratricopeptide (TPR) repeat protein